MKKKNIYVNQSQELLTLFWNSDIRIKQETMMFKKLLQYLGQDFSVKSPWLYLA